MISSTRADQGVGRLERLGRGQPHGRADRVGHRGAVVGHHGQVDPDLQLDLVEPSPGGLANPADLVQGGLVGGRGPGPLVDATGRQGDVEATMSAHRPARLKHPSPAAADQHRRPRVLDGLGPTLEAAIR